MRPGGGPGNGAGRTVRAALEVAPGELATEAAGLLARGARLALVAAHDEGEVIRVVYLFTSGPPDTRVELQVCTDAGAPAVPSLAALSFPASRFEREMADLFGVVPTGHPAPRRLVLHEQWPAGWHALRAGAGEAPVMRSVVEPFPFAPVSGQGVFEIPVGPIHAGLIESGHFRFFVQGEAILKMKARLWFLHKGIERCFEGRDPAAAIGLAERISGDSAVAHSLAFCQAAEEALGIAVGEHAAVLRAVLLELERLYNHVNDVGALCNDVGFGIANARAQVLRERLLCLNGELTGHRLLRGAITLGATVLRRLPERHELEEISARFAEIVDLAGSSAVVADRFGGTAVLAGADAEAIGTLGVVARASGSRLDARVAHGFVELGETFEVVQEPAGDVAARFAVRVREVGVSLALLRSLAQRAGGPIASRVPPALVPARSGVGIVEGWRGSVVHRIETDRVGRIRRLKVVDPSFLNWPALAVCLADTIVPDFPLANKSFSLSYAGNDL